MRKRIRRELYLSIKDKHLNKWNRVLIKTRDNKNIWFLTKQYINDQVVCGTTFTRQNLLEYIYPGIGKLMGKHETTVDHYRCLLSNDNVGILNATDKYGIYKKVRNIPDTLTTSNLKKIATDKSWKRWFIPFEDKVNN